MQSGIHYISSEKKSELEQELIDLKGPRRQAILEALAFAKSLGDLSENAEYHSAREEQGRLEERIAQIEEILRNSELVAGHSTTAVEIGATVTVKKQGDAEEKKFTLVGGQESDMARGMISYNSPLGAALMGKKKGDVVINKTPKGEITYTIVSIK